MVNMFNGVPIPVPPTFNEDLHDYPGKPRAVAHADNKIRVSEVFDNDPRSLEELVKITASASKTTTVTSAKSSRN
jgi:hypothetical protein